MGKAHCQFIEAVDNLKACGDCGSANPDRMNIMQEARKSLFEIGSQIDWLKYYSISLKKSKVFRLIYYLQKTFYKIIQYYILQKIILKFQISTSAKVN